MPVLTWISGSLLMLHLAYSNVILTANLGDFSGMMKVAKQLVQVPTLEEIADFWQSASHQVKKRYYKELAKIKSEKQKHARDNFDVDYEEPTKREHRSQPNRQLKQRRVKRISHDRVQGNRRQGGVNERLSESVVDDRPSQGDLDRTLSSGNADKKLSQDDVNQSNADQRPSQDDLGEKPSNGNVDKIPYQGKDDERQSLEVNPSQGNVTDDRATLEKNANFYLKSIDRVFENN